MSPLGTFETCRRPLRMSAYRGKVEVANRLSTDAIDPQRTSATWAVALFVRHGNKRFSSHNLRICIARVQESADYSHKAVEGPTFVQSDWFDLAQSRSAQCDYSIEHATCSFARASFQPEVFAMKISHRIFAGVSLLALSCTSALAQQI